MADEKNRGRRRPSREFRSGESHSPLEAAAPRRRDVPDIPEEPNPKTFKTEKDALKDVVATTSKNSVGSVKDEGKGDAQQTHGRSQRQRYEIVHSRPANIKTKEGIQGQPIPLTTNYFRVAKIANWTISQYHVSFEPEIELRALRAGILSQHRPIFGGYLYDGTKLFTCTRLPNDKTIIETQSKRGDNYAITIKYVGSIAMTEWQSIQILNLILRRSMEGLKLQMVGRNFFDPVAKIDMREYRLQLWPGYQTSIRQHEKDILLAVEITHKVMRTETVYDMLMKCTTGSRDYQEEFRRQVLGLTVLTDYNNKTYRVNDIQFDSTPRDTFSIKGKEISFIDYYQQKYNIRIRDPKQPLLVSKCKETFIKNENNDNVILVPELCRVTGLNDQMRSNFQLMRAMSEHTRMNPDVRIDRLRAFNSRLQNTSASVKVLKEWDLTLEKRLLEINGRVLDPQRIVFGGHNKVSAGDQADWTRMFRDNELLTTPSRGLERWSVISTNRNSRELRNFVQALLRAANGLHMRIAHPREVLIYDDRTHSFVQAIEDCARQDPKLILVLVPNNNTERYAALKKKCCLDRSIPTQIVTQKCASNQRGLMSIATKVAIQINCKLGYTPWMVDIPLSGLMTIGYDVVRSTRDRSKAFGALVATMDMKINPTFYSTVTECSSSDVLANSLWPMMTKALRQYRTEHEGKFPNRILFYRDGVSEGSLGQVFEYEVKTIVEKLEQEYKRAETEKPPMFAYINVTKSLNTRLFARGQNPPPGTIVDSAITLPERYDFYLVSQSVRQGSVSPTSYNVLYSNMGLTPDQMQLLTYKMTHLYFNWSGTTRVPAVCQYAKKLATLVSTALHQPPQNALEKKLYYL